MPQSVAKTLEEIQQRSPLYIAAGLAPGLSPVHKFGRNTLVGTAEEDVWDGGLTNWVEPTAARIHQITSTSGDDDGDPGAGAVTVEGLDGNYDLISEDVALAGVANVPTVNAYRMIHRMYVIPPSAAENVGTITATADGDATVTAQISPGNGQTLMAIFMVPRATRAYMEAFGWAINKGTGVDTFADMSIREKPLGGVWRVKHTAALATPGTSSWEKQYRTPRRIEGQTLIKVTAIASKASTDISAWFDLVLSNRPPL